MLESDAGDRRWGIKQVTVVTQEGRYTIHIELDAAGARRMEWLSATHVGMSLAILVNDTVVSMPVIRGITGSHVELTGDFTEEEALRLADALRAGIHEPATAKPATAGAPIVLGHVRDSTEKRLSYADAGHAVLFDRPQGAKSVTAVRLFCSRYGPPQPPEEDLHIYILDRNQKVIRDVPVPYAKIERGDMRWYTFEVPPTLVPERFYVAAAFNAHQTKGVYLGMDDSVKESHSYAGLPESGFKKLDEKADWMIRVLMGPK
jgi:hypothetical protein